MDGHRWPQKVHTRPARPPRKRSRRARAATAAARAAQLLEQLQQSALCTHTACNHMKQHNALLPVLRPRTRPWCTHTPLCGPPGDPAVAASTQSDQRRSAGTHSHELATKDHTWRTHPTRSALDAPLPGEAAPTALHEHAPPSHCGYLFASSPTSSRNPQILARDRSDCARGQDCGGLEAPDTLRRRWPQSAQAIISYSDGHCRAQWGT